MHDLREHSTGFEYGIIVRYFKPSNRERSAGVLQKINGHGHLCSHSAKALQYFLNLYSIAENKRYRDD